MRTERVVCWERVVSCQCSSVIFLNLAGMDRWKGRVAVVTGASSGIGTDLAIAFVKKGLIVVGLARRDNKLQELEDKLKGETGKFYWKKTDLKNADEIISAFNWIDSEIGPVDVLVNNAGIGDCGFLAVGTAESWQELLAVNVLAVNICTKEAIKSMKKHNLEEGHIINISSILGHVTSPLPGHATYAASKKAVGVLSEGLRGELFFDKSKIRVTVISPGLVKTELVEAAVKSLPPDYPMLAVEDVTETVLFVLQLPTKAQVTELCIQPLGENLAAAAMASKPF